jgi:flagellar hook-basal body complex protein FliE
LTLPISGINPISIPSSLPQAGTTGSDAFSGILSNTIDNLQSLQNQAGNAAQKFMTGENDEIHDIALAGQQAELSFELGLQVRNKVVNAYQEIMKMQL